MGNKCEKISRVLFSEEGRYKGGFRRSDQNWITMQKRKESKRKEEETFKMYFLVIELKN